MIACLQSCATFGPRRVEAPCDEEFETLLPAVQAGDGIEIVGKLRLDLPRYRVQGTRADRLFSPGKACRPDRFLALEPLRRDRGGCDHSRRRQSRHLRSRERQVSRKRFLAGARRGRDRGRGSAPRRYPRSPCSSRFHGAPRCNPPASSARDKWRLKAVWRDRRIEMRGEQRDGERRNARTASPAARDAIRSRTEIRWRPSNLVYPGWVRLSRETTGTRRPPLN